MKKLLASLVFSICLGSMLNAAATFSRVKNWSTGEILTASDLNAEFDNILNNLDPAGVDDYSSNTTDMRSVVDPYPSLSESLATSLKGELERLRYQILQIKNTIAVSSVTYWYEDLPSSGTLVLRNGRVGINTSSPTVTLDVSGNAKFRGATTLDSPVLSDGAILLGQASQNQMESGVANDYYTNPGNVKYTPGVAKAWAVFTGTGTPNLLAGSGVTTVTKNGTGDYTMNFATPFSSIIYNCQITGTWVSGTFLSVGSMDQTNFGSTTASAFRMTVRDATTANAIDANRVMVVCYGDQ